LFRAGERRADFRAEDLRARDREVDFRDAARELERRLVFREPDAPDDDLCDADDRAGTFAPFFRASERPIAIACLRLLTVRPLRPLSSVPCLRRRIALSTLSCAFLPYRAMPCLRGEWPRGRLAQHGTCHPSRPAGPARRANVLGWRGAMC
jgi:hypothetical protein